ncbi:MAG: hypothetical protein HGB37_01080 [Candidatus Moranbacteria bacterium]|nr:hypothetical protein [Candidatus Moranbacteria bacterium]
MEIRLNVISGGRLERCVQWLLEQVGLGNFLRPEECFSLPDFIGGWHIFRLLIDIRSAARLFEQAENLCPAEHHEGLMYLRRKAGILTKDEIGEAVKGLVGIARSGMPDAYLSPFALAYPFVEDFLRPGEIADRFRAIALQEDVHVMFVLRISGTSDDIPFLARVMSENIGKHQDIPFRKMGNGFYVPTNGQWNIREEQKGVQV